MTYKENITAILECCFAGFKKEIIDCACNRILEQEPKWIPVSERSPEEDNEVLITIKSCGEWYVCHSVYRDGLFWQKNFEYYSYRKPIAWMPLPKPYEPQESEEEE